MSPAVRPGAQRLTRDDDRKVAEDLLREAVSDALGDAADRVERQVVADLPGRALVHVARTVNAELIVLAARHGITRVLGTVSQYVLRNAPCPEPPPPPPSGSGAGKSSSRPFRKHAAGHWFQAGVVAGAGGISNLTDHRRKR